MDPLSFSSWKRCFCVLFVKTFSHKPAFPHFINHNPLLFSDKAAKMLFFNVTVQPDRWVSMLYSAFLPLHQMWFAVITMLPVWAPVLQLLPIQIHRVFLICYNSANSPGGVDWSAHSHSEGVFCIKKSFWADVSLRGGTRKKNLSLIMQWDGTEQYTFLITKVTNI